MLGFHGLKSSYHTTSTTSIIDNAPRLMLIEYNVAVHSICAYRYTYLIELSSSFVVYKP